MWAMFVGDETIYTVVEDVKEREIWVMWEGKGQSAGAVVSRIFDKEARDCCWRFPVV